MTDQLIGVYRAKQYDNRGMPVIREPSATTSDSCPVVISCPRRRSTRLQYLLGGCTVLLCFISMALNVAFIARNNITRHHTFLDDHHRKMIASVAHTREPTNLNRTIAVYICNDLHDTMQIGKIQELHSYFGERLIVVTDQNALQGGDDWILPADQVVAKDSNVELTTTLALNYICCGIERAIMWLVENQDRYAYAWVMEDDVLWSDFVDMKDFLNSFGRDKTDLLHSNPAMESFPTYNLSGWHWSTRLLPPYVTEQAQFYEPWRGGLFQFYRVSSRFVKALDDWRVLRNKGEWTFFEPLFANLAFHNDSITANLTTRNYISNSIGYTIKMDYRPCYTLEQVYNKSSNGGRGGLFHPVKKDVSSC